METHKRSLVKSVSWRIFGLFFTAFAAWLITGSAKAGFVIGSIDFILKIGTFYLHERFWQRVRWGLVDNTAVREGEGI